jgi:hypothetical protein
MTRSLFKIFLLMYRYSGVQIIFQPHGRLLLEKRKKDAGEGI